MLNSFCVRDILISYCLWFHPGENDIQHLRQCCFGCGLIDKVFTGQVDVETCPNHMEKGALVNVACWRRHCGQQGLTERNQYSDMLIS